MLNLNIEPSHVCLLPRAPGRWHVGCEASRMHGGASSDTAGRGARWSCRANEWWRGKQPTTGQNGWTISMNCKHQKGWQVLMYRKMYRNSRGEGGGAVKKTSAHREKHKSAVAHRPNTYLKFRTPCFAEICFRYTLFLVLGPAWFGSKVCQSKILVSNWLKTKTLANKH